MVLTAAVELPVVISVFTVETEDEARVEKAVSVPDAADVISGEAVDVADS